jgi:two-component system, chemotaxis family, protein-glutamate methylesterase/glutaminase
MPRRDHHIIVIGASLGGVEALKVLLAGLPADLDAALFVVLHLSPGRPTLLPKILSRIARIPVELASNMRAIELGHMYVAPPDQHLLIGDGHMRVVRGPKENGHRPAVDPLFRTAAHVYGPQVIAVVLTGSLDCGARGLVQVKERGGIAVVQDPHDAMSPEMPANALAAVRPDHVVPLAAIPALLVELARAPVGRERPRPAEAPTAGTASGLTCPACSGALWEEGEARLAHFVCRVGHAYSLPSMMHEHATTLEGALWTAIRTLDDAAALARRAAQRARERGAEATQVMFEERARRAEKEAQVIREALERMGEPDHTDP